MKYWIAFWIFLGVSPVQASTVEIESALAALSPQQFRPNNVYNGGRYVPGTAICAPFPGAFARIACSIDVIGTMGGYGCPWGEDRLIYRVILSTQYELVAAIHDGGENTTDRCRED